MKLFWTLHIAGALLFSALLGVYVLPDDRLPQKMVLPRGQVRSALTRALAPWVSPEGAPPSEDSFQLTKQMVQEEYEEKIAQLEQKRDNLQEQLGTREKNR